MSILEIVLSIISLIMTVLQLPAWSTALKMRMFMNTSNTRLEDLEADNKQLSEKMAEIIKQSYETELKFAEILGTLNISITRLNGTVANLNDTMARSEKHLESIVNKVYKDLAEHKDSVMRLIEVKIK